MVRKLSVCIVFLLLLAACSTNVVKQQRQLLNKASFAEDDDVKVQEANQLLAYDMLADLHVAGENVFVSPVSLFFALAMAFEAADGETKAQMAEVMHVSGLSNEAIRSGNAALLSKLLREMDAIDLHLANSIWLQDDYSFDKDFITYNEHYYTAEVETVDFQDEKTMKQINDWVAKMTNGKIANMVEETLPAENVVSLFNTVYFQGDWDLPFEEVSTMDDTFYLVDGTEKTVSFMRDTSAYDYMENDVMQAIRIPYKNDEAAMYVVLPEEGITVQDWLKDQSADTLLAIFSALAEEEVHLKIPSFEIEAKYDLVGFLQGRGMTDAFLPSVADFPHLIDDSVGGNVIISQVVQKSFIEVNEGGTEAAAATEVDFELTSAPDILDEEDPIEMIVDRPFLFMIVDEETNIPLFVGAIEEP